MPQTWDMVTVLSCMHANRNQTRTDNNNKKWPQKGVLLSTVPATI